MKRFYVEAVGKSFSIDGGENNFRGKSGFIGIYETLEEAIGVAEREKSETCTVKVFNTRAENGTELVYETK